MQLHGMRRLQRRKQQCYLLQGKTRGQCPQRRSDAEYFTLARTNRAAWSLIFPCRPMHRGQHSYSQIEVHFTRRKDGHFQLRSIRMICMFQLYQSSD